ncbi:RHS repeat-associated core domain-containing protein [Achromobacter sp. MFA1 R4]|uniref:RHS repeat-associated core domain-containing protein n=1 Tax=Achromobacter sp. MFA1 R4 TaxID=1881016 RepID=UPI0009538BF3|nr:RHS repeat-associated core domain-containing protein [Achromobacter sp. MFA1 R4]SIT30664.1 RHS repeat-associated core domain-containing protein [Achromobacter sp. MFA1 R4]
MAGPVYTYRHRSARLDNLLREYAGTHYTYDALGRRLLKQSEAHWRERPGMTPAQIREEQARANRALGCSTTLYGWDGDTLAWEGHDDQTTHYLYEPGIFVPLAQAISRKPILLHQQPAYAGAYDIDRDPLWTTSPDPDPVDALAWYHCDHLGTPQELTDAQGEIAWTAQYHAWGAAKEAITDAARAAGVRNPIRFQGQYLDRETGLHYNRHRYYDPHIGRFITKDPIGFAGGLNVYQYADNPVEWVDPLGLARSGRWTPVGNGRIRVDPPHVENTDQQVHAHCQCKSRHQEVVVNRDGTQSHGSRGKISDLTRKEMEYLRTQGFDL